MLPIIVFMLWSCKYIAWCSTTTTSSSSSNCQTICWICIRLQVYFELSNVRELVFIYKFAIVCKLVLMWENSHLLVNLYQSLKPWLIHKFLEHLFALRLLGDTSLESLLGIETSCNGKLEPGRYLCFFAHTIFSSLHLNFVARVIKKHFPTLKILCNGDQDVPLHGYHSDSDIPY
jgi:hypothetical protein